MIPSVGTQQLILAGDVGGSKTNLGIFGPGKKRPRPILVQTYSNRRLQNLESAIECFLKQRSVNTVAACFGVAGPISGGQTKLVNLPWQISENRLRQRFKWANVKLINDLTATAYAIPLLNSRELFPLNSIKIRYGHNRALVAPGTGLGQALILFHKGRYYPVASEGGHADFAPRNQDETELWMYLHRKYGHVSMERVLTGSGLNNIYSWLLDSGRFTEPEWLTRKMEKTDPARAISEGAIVNSVPVCEAALRMFVSILGAVAGNLALTGTAAGGVYLGGGIMTKILPKINKQVILKAFADKGRLKPYLETIPIRVILNDKAALIGAAYAAFEMIRA